MQNIEFGFKVAYDLVNSKQGTCIYRLYIMYEFVCGYSYFSYSYFSYSYFSYIKHCVYINSGLGLIFMLEVMMHFLMPFKYVKAGIDVNSGKERMLTSDLYKNDYSKK